MNHFEVFGLPRKLGIDLKDLERAFHELSRKYHPDYFSAAPAPERERALRMTAALNDAYRTLRHPVRRVEHLLALEGLKPDGSKVPKAFLMEIFEINEQLDAVKSGSASPAAAAALRRDIEARAEAFESQLATAAGEWDRLLDAGSNAEARKRQLNRLTEILSASAYVRNLERDLEDTP